MRQLLILLLAILYISPITYAQSIKAIPNGDFENWDSTSYVDLDSSWLTTNAFQIANFGKAGITKVPGKSGSAVHLQAFAVGNDTFTNKMAMFLGVNQAVKGISGYYRCNLVGSDLASISVSLIRGGLTLGDTTFYFTGSVNTFTAFNFPFNFAITPDSIAIAISSSILGVYYYSSPGSIDSWFELDGMALTGTGAIPPIPDGDFDSWTTRSILMPSGWEVYNNLFSNNVGVYKSTDHYSGRYSLEMTGQMLSSGQFNQGGGIQAGEPYVQSGGLHDTITGYYKYIPSDLDSAAISFGLQETGIYAGWDTSYILPPSPSWKYFELPFITPISSDTMEIDIRSSYRGNRLSTLFLDDLQLASQPHTSSIPNTPKPAFGITAFPNPAQNQLNIRFGNNVPSEFDIKIYNPEGRLVMDYGIHPGSSTFTVPIEQLSAGLYFYEITSNGNTVRNKFVKIN